MHVGKSPAARTIIYVRIILEFILKMGREKLNTFH
jgi:hypothetical protein